MTRSLLALALLPLLLVGCDTGGDTELDTETRPAPEAETAPAAAPPGSTPQTMTQLPDTTAEAVWSYLQEVRYQDEWQRWPGTEELYEGTEPHGMLLTTYMNPTAREALTSGSVPLPTGSIVVKENYQPDSTLEAVTVMYARDGYDPEHNDYFWAKYGAAGDVEAAGRVESCQSCHMQGETGYLRTAYDPEADGGM